MVFMTDKYEYHKQNDYPGERVAERKRVADRKLASDRKADARVAEKGRTERLKADKRVAEKGRTEGLRADARVAAKGRRDDDLMDAEIDRSTARAKRVHTERNATDGILVLIIAGILVVLVVGFIAGYMALQSQADSIDTLNLQLANTGIVNYDNFQLSDEARQVQLYNDFIILTDDVQSEIVALEDYNIIYSDSYQLCASFTERENNINHATFRFAEKKIVYYDQIAVLADKPECASRIQDMRWAMAEKKVADEQLYMETKKVCDEIIDNTTTSAALSRPGWNAAQTDAYNKAQVFASAEESVKNCLA